MADYYQHHVMWYTVYDAKTGDLIASGTSEMCARRLGYKSSNGFASAAGHRIHRQEKPGSRPGKYIIDREVIPREEMDSLPAPVRRRWKKKKPAGITSTSGSKKKVDG